MRVARNQGGSENPIHSGVSGVQEVARNDEGQGRLAERQDDLDLGHLFRVIFMQGGQVAIGTAIGAGVLLLVGIVAVFLAPIWLPIFAFVYWRRKKRKKAAGGQDISDLVPIPIRAPAGNDAGRPTSEARRGGEAPSAQV